MPVDYLAPKFAVALLAVIDIAAAENGVRGHECAELAPNADGLAQIPGATQAGVRICATFFAAASRAPDGRGAWRRRCPFTVPVPPVNRTQAHKHYQLASTLGAGAIGRPSGTLPVSVSYQAAGSRIVVCDGGLRLFQEAFVRCRAPTAKWKSTLGTTHPRKQIRQQYTTAGAVTQDSIQHVVTWSPTVRSCRDLGLCSECPFWSHVLLTPRLPSAGAVQMLHIARTGTNCTG